MRFETLAVIHWYDQIPQMYEAERVPPTFDELANALAESEKEALRQEAAAARKELVRRRRRQELVRRNSAVRIQAWVRMLFCCRAFQAARVAIVNVQRSSGLVCMDEQIKHATALRNAAVRLSRILRGAWRLDHQYMLMQGVVMMAQSAP